MRAWLQGGLLAALVFGVSWGGAVWYWRATNRLPSPVDLLMYMLLLPLALMLLFWSGRKMIRAATASAPGATAAAGAAAPEPASAAIPALAIVAAALSTAHGDVPGAVAAALAAGKARGDIDPALFDDDGYAITSTRIDIDTDAVREPFAQWLADGTLVDPEFSDEQWRALTLATTVLAELAASAASHNALNEPDKHGAVPMLQLLPVLPAGWNEAQRRSASLWLRHLAAQAGWPEQRISATAPAAGLLPAPALAQLARHAATSGEPLVAIVLGCGSHLSQETVRAWAAGDTLFTATRLQGLMPGEAAAGVLLADLRQAALIDTRPHPQLRCAAGVRATSADTARQADAGVLAGLCKQLYAGAAIEPDSVGMIVADSDHREVRMMEVMALATSTAPHLSKSADLQHAGTACASCGPASFMVGLALAHHHAIELGQPVLCVSVDDPFNRSAALVTPPNAALSSTPVSPSFPTES